MSRHKFGNLDATININSSPYLGTISITLGDGGTYYLEPNEVELLALALTQAVKDARDYRSRK